MSGEVTRKLPVYLVIDCSHSMRGEPISMVNSGLAKLVADLKNNPYALETVWLGVVTFSTGAELLVPLTEAYQLQIPELRAKGRSDLGAALKIVHEQLRTEVRPSSIECKGDWRPVVFVMSDGAPSDGWITPAKQVRARHDNGSSIVIAFGFGSKVRVENLQRITPQVMVSRSTEPESLSRFLQWASVSINHSCSIARGGIDSLVALPPPPSGLYICPP